MTSRFLTSRVAREMSGGTKVWSQVTALGKMPGVTDLGQGYPDTVGCEVARVRKRLFLRSSLFLFYLHRSLFFRAFRYARYAQYVRS